MNNIDKLNDLYAERDARKLEPHYSKHVNAMTGEGLHDKSDIAAELAFRDAEIGALKHDIERVMAINTELLNGEAMKEVLHGNTTKQAEIERLEARYRKLAGALRYNEGDKTIDPEQRIEKLEAQLGHAKAFGEATDNSLQYERKQIAELETEIEHLKKSNDHLGDSSAAPLNDRRKLEQRIEQLEAALRARDDHRGITETLIGTLKLELKDACDKLDALDEQTIIARKAIESTDQGNVSK